MKRGQKKVKRTKAERINYLKANLDNIDKAMDIIWFKTIKANEQR